MEITVATLIGAYMIGLSAHQAKDMEGLGALLIIKELMTGAPSEVVLRTLTELGAKMSERRAIGAEPG